MKSSINPKIILWALGLIQPATPLQVQHCLETAFSHSGVKPQLEEISKLLNLWLTNGYTAKSSQSLDNYYSLTLLGNQALPRKVRYNKDRTRLFLLKNARQKARRTSGVSKKTDGVSPSGFVSIEKQGRRPENPVVDPSDRLLWSSAYRQLIPTAGKNSKQPEVRLPLLSFDSFTQLSIANQKDIHGIEELDISSIALCMGISPNLLIYLLRNTPKQYREFSIPKRSGGLRNIHSPRVFLKTLQHWLCDYILTSLPIHETCHSYRYRHSILTNAQNHVGKEFVANLDIANYFGNINQDILLKHLMQHYNDNLALLISNISTLNGSTPQGAPTSPQLSNSILFDIDSSISHFCAESELSYTRYSDDITISGNDITSIHDAISMLGSKLNTLGFEINHKKTRIANKGCRQSVTGVTVNEKAQPSREKRRIIRSIFHRVSLNPNQFIDKIDCLRGYISYLESYPAQRESKHINKYKQILEAITSSPPSST